MALKHMALTGASTPESTVGDPFVDAAGFTAATLHEAAGRLGSLPAAIKPVHARFRICGPAFPVRCPPGNNLQIHHGLLAARPGDVLVVDVGRIDVGHGEDFGYWGEILSIAATARGLAGVVIGGGARDTAEIDTVGFPVFSAGICLRGTGKSAADGAVGEPVHIGPVRIAAGDLVVGDVDGVVALARDTVAEVVRAAEARVRKEDEIMVRLRAGESTVDLLGLGAIA